ncbi:telomerase Cajal body protein 1 isoform X2 [Zootermopsis nevadensis]|nr:telomerase Cajal body protein 1 isoform X2 [Zootermopsis nevadensis]
MILSADVSLTKQGEEGNETKRGAELLHGNDHEYNDMNSDMEVKCNQGEIFVTNTLIEKADSVVDSHTVSHLKHIDNISSAEEAPQEIISAASDLQSYSLQEYKFENSSQITRAWREFNKKEDICMKGCKWSPDGTCILTNSDDNVLRVFDLPPELHCQESWQEGRILPELKPALQVAEGGLIYDYCWYPLMSSWNPLSCCLVSTSKDSPIHLWDAFTGELRCTYRAYNAVDEVEAAHSLAFSPSGEKLYCGFKNSIRIFNTNNPGRQCETRNLKQSSFSSQRQTGIISCICVNPAMPDIYVVGSYTKSIGVYSEPNGSVLCLLLGHSGGITHLQFSPDGTKLLSGGRKDSEVICWDIRNPGTVLFSVQRDVATNQRMYFDITPDSRYLVSGNTNGCVSVWDMLQISRATAEETVLSSCTSFTAHSDCVNGISIHQQYPILATASGQRHMRHSESESDSSMDSSYQETCLKLWWVGNIASES